MSLIGLRPTMIRPTRTGVSTRLECDMAEGERAAMTHSRLHEGITFGREKAGDSATIDALEDCRRQRWSSGSAQRLVTHLLRDLPDRLAHSLSAGEKARRLSGAVQDADADLLVSAAL